MMNRKGNLQIIVPAILTLVLAATILVFGLIITQELRDTDALTSQLQTVTNETGAYINDTNPYVLAGATASGFNSVSISAARGGTNASNPVEAIESANFTVNAVSGEITNTTSETYVNVELDYTYQQGGIAFVAANDTIVGLGTFADFWEIIVLAVIITVIIGLLLVVFTGRRVT